jgi:hypothetical protein
MRLNRKAVASACAAAIMLATTTSALAAGISTSQAVRASTPAAQAVGKETHASRVKLIGCNRITSRKTVCHGEARYSIGSRRCTFDIVVTQASNSQRLRTSPSNFLCY